MNAVLAVYAAAQLVAIAAAAVMAHRWARPYRSH